MFKIIINITTYYLQDIFILLRNLNDIRIFLYFLFFKYEN